jgi:hypothetical protein
MPGKRGAPAGNKNAGGGGVSGAANKLANYRTLRATGSGRVISAVSVLAGDNKVGRAARTISAYNQGRATGSGRVISALSAKTKMM